jgi:hypothetical protein
MNPLRVGYATLLVVGLASVPVCAATALPSDSVAASELRLAIGQRPWVRVESLAGRAIIMKPRVTTAGLEFSEVRPVMPRADLGSPPSPIPLAQLYRVEVPVDASTGGCFLGALVGAVAGMLVVQGMSNLSGIMSSPELATPGEMMGGAALGGVTGGVLGALIGSTFRDMKQVYPRSLPPVR